MLQNTVKQLCKNVTWSKPHSQVASPFHQTPRHLDNSSAHTMVNYHSFPPFRKSLGRAFNHTHTSWSRPQNFSCCCCSWPKLLVHIYRIGQLGPHMHLASLDQVLEICCDVNKRVVDIYMAPVLQGRTIVQ